MYKGKIFAQNKKAFYDYTILETFEAGLALIGQEVKSIKNSRISLKGSYIIIRNNELFLIGAKIPAYQPKNAPKDYDEERFRKLLLKKAEIKYLIGKSKQKGLTLMPLKVYNKNNRIKIEFGIAQGKKKYDKREVIKNREFKREKARLLKS